MRLFIAINFDEAARDEMYACALRLREKADSCRISSRDNLHITLAFLGETQPARLEAVKDAMRDAAGKTAAFDLDLEGAGRFRRREGGDIWWLKAGDCPTLTLLQERVSAALRRGGFALERRDFSPHLTIAREVFAPKGVNAAAISPPKLCQHVSGIELMLSERQNGQLVYTPLFSAPLRDP